MNFDLEYNAERSDLIIPEYGRHIQKLVNHCKGLEDREERNKMARAIVGVMGNIQPHLRDVPDFKHKLWDQLFIMAEFELDVDSPYDKPSREELAEKPIHLGYPTLASKYRYYGNTIQIMIDEAITWPEDDKRDGLYFAIANHMKKCYLNWNKDTVDDHIIFKHLLVLSHGEIDLEPRGEALSDSKNFLRKKTNTNTSSPKGGHKGGQKSSNKKKNYSKRTFKRN
ncbi:MAG: methionyl-tRNA formyltransferase [Flavobacteriaceae bacterium]|nr:MAG: methionyl-tRNA formyltransferase [Flavobacteriaceae bacterium]